MEDDRSEDGDDRMGEILTNFSKVEVIPQAQEQIGIRVRHSMVWDHAVQCRSLIRQVSQGVSLTAPIEEHVTGKSKRLIRMATEINLHRHDTLLRTSIKLKSKRNLGTRPGPGGLTATASHLNLTGLVQETSARDTHNQERDAKETPDGKLGSAGDERIEQSSQAGGGLLRSPLESGQLAVVFGDQYVSRKRRDHAPGGAPAASKHTSEVKSLPTKTPSKSHHVEYMRGERLFYGCRISLESIASGRYLVSSSTGACETNTTGNLNNAATFTLVDLDDLGNNGMIKFGDALWLQASSHEVVAARISYDIKRAHAIEKVGTRVGKPVMRKLDRSSNLNAKWIVSRPYLADNKATNPYSLLRKEREVGHLSCVCMEQVWHYLADDESTGTSVRQGLYCPNGIVEAGTNKGIESAGIWRIHLLHNGGRIKSVPRDELVLSTAQQQLKHSQEKCKATMNLTHRIRGEMRMFAKQKESQGLHVLMYQASAARRPKTTSKVNSNNLSPKSGINESEPSFSDGSPCASWKFRPDAEKSANSSKWWTGGKHTSPLERTRGRTGNAKRKKALEDAKVAADAVAAESMVSREVWAEIQAQEAFIEQQLSQDWNLAALALQKAWRKWARGKWKRKLEKLDSECREQVNVDSQKQKEAAAAAAILSKVVDRAQQSDESDQSIFESVSAPQSSLCDVSMSSTHKHDASQRVECNVETPGSFLTEVESSIHSDDTCQVDKIHSTSATPPSTSSGVSAQPSWFDTEPGLTRFSMLSSTKATPQKLKPRMYRSNTKRFLAAAEISRVHDQLRVHGIKTQLGGEDFILTTQEQLKIMHCYKPQVYSTKDENIESKWKNQRCMEQGESPLRNAIGIHREVLQRARRRHENVRPQTAQPFRQRNAANVAKRKVPQRPRSAISLEYRQGSKRKGMLPQATPSHQNAKDRSKSSKTKSYKCRMR